MQEDEEEESAWIPLSSNTEGKEECFSVTDTSFPTGMESLQEKIEHRILLKSSLFDHPMDLFWRRYLLHFAKEIWALDWRLRLGLLFASFGAVLQCFMWTTWFFWYPRMILSLAIILVSTLYLDPFNLELNLHVTSKFYDFPEASLEGTNQIHVRGIRHLAALLLFVPTILEMRTLSFLSKITMENERCGFPAVPSILLLMLMVFCLRFLHLDPKECLYRGLVALYAIALMISVHARDLERLPYLLGPFLTASGTLLIAYKDNDMEWISKALRYSLRLTLRDILASISNKVSKDDLLKLAILRWIADYWATTLTSTGNVNQTSSDSTASFPTDKKELSTETIKTPIEKARASTCLAQQKKQSTLSILSQREDLSWDDFLPMLSMATEHMTSEVNILQSDPASNLFATEEELPRHPSTTSYDPIYDFQSVLESWHVDERAEPTLNAYKQAVANFPPKHQTAILMSIARRCPAILLLIFDTITFQSAFLLHSCLLLPFVVMEVCRISTWFRTCELLRPYFPFNAMTKKSFSIFPPSFVHLDPMAILLAGDNCHARRTILLLVWQNIQNSVTALEVGLTAAKCAQTGAVAARFAGDVLSLVQLGHEFHQGGLLNGLVTIGKEAILFHTLDESLRHRRATRYTSAALSIAKNTQLIFKNTQELATNDHVHQALQSMVHVLLTFPGFSIFGRNDNIGAETNDQGTAEPETIPFHECSKTQSSEEQILSKLSDLMDEIVIAYSNHYITAVQKDKLCEQLSSLRPSDHAEINRVRLSLQQLASDNIHNMDDVLRLDTTTSNFKSTSNLMDETETFSSNNMRNRDQNEGSRDKSSDSSSSIDKEVRRIQAAPKKEESVHSSGTASIRETSIQKNLNTSSAMELVLAAYYKGLIDELEKTAFCAQLASLSEKNEEDKSNMMKGIIITLNGIMENDQRRLQDGSQIVNETPAVDGHELRLSQDSSDFRSTASDRCNQNEAWGRIGMAALSVVVGKVLSSKKNEREESFCSTNRTDESDNGETIDYTNQASTVQIEEIIDDSDDEWIAVPQ